MMPRKSSSVKIVPMQTDDEIDGKAYVHWKSWQETYDGLIDQSYLDGMTLEKCIKMAHRWRDNILIAKDGDRVIGFISYGNYRDSSLPNAAEIYAIYLLRDYQGCKIGYRLMNAAMEQLSNYKQIALWVLHENKQAINFYQKYGFTFDGIQKEVIIGTPKHEKRMIYQSNCSQKHL